jgi:peptide-methionine (S)-S-oxide reductase
MFFTRSKPMRLPTEGEAMPGRTAPLATAARHAVTGAPLKGPFASGTRTLVIGMGCFWGAERRYWTQEGVISTAAGYAGGITPNPTYAEVCSGLTGHTEVVRVDYDPARIDLEALLTVFWEAHDPTQGMRQGNDVGTQYRSALFAQTEADLAEIEASAARYGARLAAAGLGPITTEIRFEPVFYYAEADHQQYLHKTPGGYCGLRGTGVSCG